MNWLEGVKTTLRPLEPEDIDLLYAWENDTENWKVSLMQVPISREILRKFIAQAGDVYRDQQIRFMIENKEDGTPIGTADIFDCDFQHGRAGVGILIGYPEMRQQGFASDALDLLGKYAQNVLELSQLYAHIAVGNEGSKRLFNKMGYETSGCLKNWIRTWEGTSDVWVVQKIFNDVGK